MPPTVRAARAAAAEGRRPFVDSILNDFVAQSGIFVPEEVRTFILNEVLQPDAEWEEAMATQTLDVDRTRRILMDSLIETARRARRNNLI